MSALVQPSPQTPATAPSAMTAPATRSRCPECQTPLGRLRSPNQLFCSIAHRDRWNNRTAARGKILTPLAIVDRMTRSGTRGNEEAKAVGREAASHAAILIQRWRDEDAAAGRMGWPEYLQRRYAVGFDPL